MFGRQCRLLFRKSDTVRDLIELVYNNLLGPIRVLSITRSRYILILEQIVINSLDHYKMTISEFLSALFLFG